ncbi:hypothetical protein HYN59_06175 [Flavobacterium album]|uniref:DUF8192 domain-containing protein n=1 Tax=Flavobacterium album TaxID=2175091 RepID=A0A2S1QWF0_9FLAO|nr:hypothetical protein [Flavobacterium album]AWH84732.1 hypothetical protein HYN59_06175 [Flavobacterium album]
MKNYLQLLLLMASMGMYAQYIGKCGLDNDPALTDEEAAFLNEYFNKSDRKGFDFTGKKVLILGGSAGSRLCGKEDYFKSIKDRIEVTTLPIASDPYPLTEEEKRLSGGYDAVLTFWTKVPMTRDKIKRVVRRVAEGIWEVPGVA